MEHSSTRSVQVPDHVALADDADHGGPVRGHDEGADTPVGEDLNQAGHALIGPDRRDLGPFGTQHVGDLHTRTVTGQGPWRHR
jgi:hypothetical protein